MSRNTDEGDIIRVTMKGQATIPKELPERFGIETPGRVFIHEEGGKIVFESLPSVEDMEGVHAGRYERGEVLERLRDMAEADAQLERELDEQPDSRR